MSTALLTPTMAMDRIKAVVLDINPPGEQAVYMRGLDGFLRWCQRVAPDAFLF